jgi:MarC family membrane protein
MTLISATILLFMVLDPFGNIPLFLSVLAVVPKQKRRRVVMRELLIALLILIAFFFAGPYFLEMLQISAPALRIAGGIILFLIALKMIFGAVEHMFGDTPEGEPLIVPLAVPCVAGPSAVATILLLVGQEPNRWPEWLLSLFLAWISCAVILMGSTKLADFMGRRGLYAIERLMGLLLTAIAIEMLLQGIHAVMEG